MKIEKIKEKIEKCKNMNLDDINLEEIDEISEIKIDKRKSSNDRILDFLNKTKNPYIFKSNGKKVKISFTENERTADDCLTNVLKNLY